MSALAELSRTLRQQGGPVAAALNGDAPAPADADEPTPAALAVAGPRCRERPAEYELLLESIYEGYLLHYGQPRLLHTDDADLALLAGDQLYALGLARLVELGDVEAVRELADVIGLTAQAHAAGDRELARAVWLAGARAVGWGASAAHAHAKRLAWEGDEGAAEALLALGASA